MKLFSKVVMKKLVFSGLFTLFLLIITEIILSFFHILPDGYFTATPNSSFTWEISPNQIIGIQGDSEVKFDRIGSRSTSNFADKKKKIVAFGGSTTACFALTQNRTWTALLEEKLGDSYWVGNFGRPGNSSNHNVLQFKHILEKPELSDVNTVLIMQGANDFISYLVSPERYLTPTNKNIERVTFQHVPLVSKPFPKNIILYQLALKLKSKIMFQLKYKDHLTKTATSIKSSRLESKLIDHLPNLDKGLNHFEKNILDIIKMAKNKKITVVFTTQATMWKPSLEPQYEKLIMTSGFQNNEAFYSTIAFSRGMDLFNERLLKICKANNIPCLDLKLPKTTESFYDDFHFNESGARLVSNRIFTFLKQKK
jgi:lysophospholipase L1-like esterase